MSSRPPKPEYDIPKLTPEQNAVKDRLWEIKRELTKLQRERAEIQNSCTHVWVATDAGNPYRWSTHRKEWVIEATAFCILCNSDSGRWVCTRSPSGMCEYEDDDVCCDTCNHCGDPDERK
jgi:hypothetical protein